LLSASGWRLAFIAVLPVSIAFGTAFAVLDTGPTYFTCRHILVIAAFTSWIFSAMFTSFTSFLSRLGFVGGKNLWRIILAKDFLIGVTILVLIILSSCGLWNSCYCWGGVMVHSEEGARITPNPTEVFDYNNNVVYPAMVGTCLFVQVCIFGIMLRVGWPGFRAMWWTEKQKLAASGRRLYPQVSSSAVQLDAVDSEPASVPFQVKEDNPHSNDQIQDSVQISITPVSPEEPAAATYTVP
jgi:hypothetical protein